MRIVFLCPADNTPTGGIKVIYRHAELLGDLGCRAFVMHPFDHDFTCTWFSHSVDLLRKPDLFPASDFVIIPEIWAAIFGGQCLSLGIPYAILVQNGYLTHTFLPSPTFAALDEIYEKAALILSISNDTTDMILLNYPQINPSRLVPTRYSVGRVFQSNPRLPRCGGVVSYMPRKLADHSARVAFALRNHLPPEWDVRSIHNANEVECAAALSQSSIFMSFSEFEGLPLPPLEAAIAGNMVIGYTGQGAKDYWIGSLFQEIDQGNLVSFVRAVADAAWRFHRNAVDLSDLQSQARHLAQAYSLETERECLTHLKSRIMAVMGHSPYREPPHGATGLVKIGSTEAEAA